MLNERERKFRYTRHSYDKFDIKMLADAILSYYKKTSRKGKIITIVTGKGGKNKFDHIRITYTFCKRMYKKYNRHDSRRRKVLYSRSRRHKCRI